MTKLVRRLLDVLEGREKPTTDWYLHPDYHPRFADLLRRADKYKFLKVPGQRYQTVAKDAQGRDATVTRWKSDMPSRDELTWVAEGLVPLPAPVTWFEFVLGGIPGGILFMSDDDKLSTMRFDLVRRKPFTMGVMPYIEKDQLRKQCAAAATSDVASNGSDAMTTLDIMVTDFADGKFGFSERTQAMKQAMRETHEHTTLMVCVSLLMWLRGKTTEHQSVHPGAGCPLPENNNQGQMSYTNVDIWPGNGGATLTMDADGSVVGCKKRQHVVRSHPRWLKGRDKPIPVIRHLRGDPTIGKVIRTGATVHG